LTVCSIRAVGIERRLASHLGDDGGQT
jgi:hypothetical protein